MSRPSRSGLTLVELLAVVAIVGLLVALLMPAVQSARESARRMQCANNLKQWGVGLHAFHQSNNTFPSGSQARIPPRHGLTNWSTALWPFVDLSTLWNRFDANIGLRGPNWDAVNGAIFRTVIPLNQCPSDTAGVFANEPFIQPTTGYTRSNYVACHSPDGAMMEKNTPWNPGFDQGCNAAMNPASGKRALFNWWVTRSTAQVRDGTSNTVALSELIAGPSGTPDLRGIWWSELGAGYTHLRTPNSNIPDNLLSHTGYCSPGKAPCMGNASCWSTTFQAARSYHVGGVNATLADGAVRFFTDQIDAATWIALASINGKDPVSID